ncbi:MAG: hypothetical protein LBI10_08920 [Deltaproteobacteria bacterium]|nr:hypothetical protein [Deltaproteobacteria bacterium]
MATRLTPKKNTSHKVLGDILKELKKVSQGAATYEVANMTQMSVSQITGNNLFATLLA